MTESPSAPAGANRLAVVAIGLLLVLYAWAAWQGWPQEATVKINAPAAAGHAPHAPPPMFMVAPFLALLGAIAVLPLVPAMHRWWDENRNKFLVAGGLGLATLAYYALLHREPVDRHFLGHGVIQPAAAGAPSWELAGGVFQNAIFADFVPFIVLLFSLYAISGGIRIEGNLQASPSTNTMFLMAGAVLASFIGTTGAAMLLIRPLLETNRERKHVRHTVVFFIFVVCNCGGCLLPLGDPPLFLGYLQGVDFLWTTRLWQPWLLVNGALLTIYIAFDTFVKHPQEEPSLVVLDVANVRKLTFRGLFLNGLLLLGVVAAVGLLDPSKPVPGLNGWHSWLYLREAVLLALVGVSLAFGDKSVREANRFTYAAIVEVAALFVGIFLCMQPALQILHANGKELGIEAPWQFFWAAGSLSSVLDNAPTYLVFFETARALSEGEAGLPPWGVPHALLAAISLGAVFMGANTYIGNGPNFMVKAIAEKSGVSMPSFFGYMLYSGLVLLPLFALTTALFFWN